jgi:hypothetical protein
VDHEVIEELLAGYALRSLDAEDAREADRLLADHVPTCATCRELLAAFQEVAGDLALETPPMPPPDVLLPRLHRAVERRGGAGRRSPFVAAAAAGLVVIVGLGALAIDQGMRARHAVDQTAVLARLEDFSRQAGARPVPVGQVTSYVHPGVEDFFLEGSHVPPPAPGTVYHVWVANGTSYHHLTSFVPEDGLVVRELEIDPTRYDRILISEQPEGVTQGPPEHVTWQSPLEAAAG